MKAFFRVLAISLVTISQVFAGIREKLHILPDSPGWTYQKLNLLAQTSLFEPAGKPDPLRDAILLGERSLAWLGHLNTYRDEPNKLQLTKPGDLKGIPIESPLLYSNRSISQEHQAILLDIPEALKAILVAGGSFSDSLPVEEESYLLWAKRIDRNYQVAARWKLLQPYLPSLEQRQSEDVRGFYFLSKKIENVEGFLRSFDGLTEERKKEVRIWLIQMCSNSEGRFVSCKQLVNKAEQSQKLYELYLKYLPGSQELWDSYFDLHNPRREIVWTSQSPLKMLVPFQDPSDVKILDFLRFNIEDEWRWDLWELTLDFRKSAAIHVQFQPGVTPHVNGLGGDTIVMDQNAPLTEWDVQWTIRHEFGHVLGFMDCYVEFYDSTEKTIVTYQLDITNMMCARSGRMQQTHFETLKRNYLR